MKENGVDIYVHFNTDNHNSEYIGAHERFIEFLSGFTGSNATIAVTEDCAFLWTDGRYFIQAEREIAKSGFSMLRQGAFGDITLLDFIKKTAKKGTVLGVDGRYVTRADFKRYEKPVKKNKGAIRCDFWPISHIWKDRPSQVSSKAFILSKEYSGKSSFQKIKKLLSEIKRAGATSMVISDLCEIAWLLNIRAMDISYVPVMYGYLYVSGDGVVLFCNRDSVKAIRKDIEKEVGLPLEIHPIEEVYEHFSHIKNQKILVDENTINISLVEALSENELMYKESPVIYLKAIKNKTEIKNSIESHIADGVALTKIIYRIKNNKENLREMQVSSMLSEERAKIKGYVSDSFETIAAYGGNAAMMHYSPKNANAKIEPRGFLLIDSGGHYLKGTTDVTRTIAMGPLTEEEKYYYTLVLKGHLALMNAKFPKGVSGVAIDYAARRFLWELGEDYNCGTGHGVGYLLSVHEGPNAIRPRIVKKNAPIEPGMITTDEPGYYKKGEFGIRIENELLCVPYKKTEYGEFYKFRALTFAPYEREAIVLEMLSLEERGWLNSYNKMIYRMLKPYLDDGEREWLREVTKCI